MNCSAFLITMGLAFVVGIAVADITEKQATSFIGNYSKANKGLLTEEEWDNAMYCNHSKSSQIKFSEASTAAPNDPNETDAVKTVSVKKLMAICNQEKYQTDHLQRIIRTYGR